MRRTKRVTTVIGDKRMRFSKFGILPDFVPYNIRALPGQRKYVLVTFVYGLFETKFYHNRLTRTRTINYVIIMR